jgi:hypothetical protein
MEKVPGSPTLARVVKVVSYSRNPIVVAIVEHPRPEVHLMLAEPTRNGQRERQDVMWFCTR